MTKLNNMPALRFKEFVGEWEKTTINEILSIGSGKDYKHLEFGEIPVYGSGGYMLSVNKFLHNGESVCIGRKGTIDNPIYLNEKFWTVDTLFYTHSFVKSIPYFVYLLFNRINWYKYNEASGVPSLSKNTISKIKITIPTKPEQQKIANFLTAIDKKIQQLREKHRLLEAYKKGIMQQIFKQDIRFKDDDGGSFGDWEVKRLGEVAKVYQPKTISQADLIKVGYPVYGANGIIGHYSEYNHFTEQIAVTCRGSTCGVINYTKPKSWITGNAMVVNTDEFYNVIKKFIFYLLTNSNLKYLITGSGQPQITGDIKKHKIYIPELKEQQKIANFLSSIDVKIGQVRQQVEAMEEFKKGLLQGMFV